MADYEVLDEKVTHLLAQRRDIGIYVSCAWLTQRGQAAIALLEPIHDVQFASIRASRLKAMDETPIMARPSGGARRLIRWRCKQKSGL